MNASPVLSIIIVNYNGGELIQRCLAAIFEHPPRRHFEIIVIDNASGDGSPELIAENFPDVRLIRSDVNGGLCKAFNHGARVTTAPYLLSLDNDTRVLENALDELLEFMENNPDVGGVGSNLYNPDMSLQYASRRFPGALSALFGRRSLLTRLFPNNPVSHHDLMTDCRYDDAPFEVHWHSAASLLLRREALERIGGWNESYFVYWSDADLCARMRAAGYRIYNVPKSRIVHDETLSGRKGPRHPRMVIDFHEGAYRFYRTHRLRWRFHPLAPIAWLGLRLRAAALILYDYVRARADSKSR